MKTSMAMRLAAILLPVLFMFFDVGMVRADVAATRHNLSISGPGPIKAVAEQEICVFCHTPHDARRDTPYLWNRADSTANYTTYQSSTLYATVGQPSGASKLCLSCHDGTIALGAVLSRPTEIPFAGGLRFVPEGPSLLGTDLSDDHPVSFAYDAGLAAANGELAAPSGLTGDVKLDGNGQMQCTSCHDPHDDTQGNFLVASNQYSALCTTCHLRRDWDVSSHAMSNATWNGVTPNPWPHTSYNTVAETACENCHAPHNAGSHAELLNYAIEEDNCLTCHNANVAKTDIASELTKTYSHRVQDFVGIHDPAEDFAGSVTKHVECADCHNPHRATDVPASPPLVPGALAGVKGVSSTGSQLAEAANTYEVCFKCHADNNVLSFAPIARQNQQVNTRLEFDVTNPSYHPVEGPGRNLNVPSLISPLTVNSIISCTDCHNNDDTASSGGTVPKGPHGSMNQYLLERNYTTTDSTNESSFEYALCYKCHDRASILADESFAEHDRHLSRVKAPCSVCHDPHGVSVTQGNSTNNSHLINFDTNVVFPNRNGDLRFEDRGTFAGACYLQCHNNRHSPRTYP